MSTTARLTGPPPSRPRVPAGKCGAPIQTTSGARGICLRDQHGGAKQCGRCSPHCQCASARCAYWVDTSTTGTGDLNGTRKPQRLILTREASTAQDHGRCGVAASSAGVVEGKRRKKRSFRPPKPRPGASMSLCEMGGPDTVRGIGECEWSHFAQASTAGKESCARASDPWCSAEIVHHRCGADCVVFCKWDFVGWTTDDLMFCGVYQDPHPHTSTLVVERGRLVLSLYGRKTKIARVSDLSQSPWSRARRAWMWRASRAARVAEDFVELVIAGVVELVGPGHRCPPDKGEHGTPVPVIFDQPLPYYGRTLVPDGCCLVDVSGVQWWIDTRHGKVAGCPVGEQTNVHIYPVGLAGMPAGLRSSSITRSGEYGEQISSFSPENCVKLGTLENKDVFARVLDLWQVTTVVIRPQDVLDGALDSKRDYPRRTPSLIGGSRAPLFFTQLSAPLDEWREVPTGWKGPKRLSLSPGQQSERECPRVACVAVVNELLDYGPRATGPLDCSLSVPELLEGAGVVGCLPPPGLETVNLDHSFLDGAPRQVPHSGDSDSETESVLEGWAQRDSHAFDGTVRPCNAAEEAASRGGLVLAGVGLDFSNRPPEGQVEAGVWAESLPPHLTTHMGRKRSHYTARTRRGDADSQAPIRAPRTVEKPAGEREWLKRGLEEIGSRILPSDDAATAQYAVAAINSYIITSPIVPHQIVPHP